VAASAKARTVAAEAMEVLYPKRLIKTEAAGMLILSTIGHMAFKHNPSGPISDRQARNS